MCQQLKFTLNRSYYPLGTNGLLYLGDELICFTIELPWFDNKQEVSCIIEGTYVMTIIDHEDYGKVIRLETVPGRSGIDFHPANNALKELKGCIAPVSKLTGEGLGTYSRRAFDKLMEKVIQANRDGLECVLHITSDGTVVLIKDLINMDAWIS